jgi:hypothetical protein
MGKRKTPKRMLTLEEQLAAMPLRPVAGLTAEPWMEADVVKAQLDWDRRHKALKDAIRARDAKKYRETGRDPAGNFGPSPYAARGHQVEVAPKDLGKELPAQSQFPKRIATQRVIDRYRAHGHITTKEWLAGDRLWQLWHAAGWNPAVTSAYVGKVDNNTTHSGQLSHRIEAAEAFLKAMKAVPYHAKGVVQHVVIIDASASDWARVRGYGQRHSQRLGLKRLRQGLSALVAHFRY